VLSMVRSLASEWGPKGIRTVMVAPGLFPTAGASARRDLDSAEYEAQVARVPVRRAGRHAGLADLCSYLMSEHAGFIDGDCITMDGGAAHVEGGDGTVQYLHDWGPDQWEEFRARAARTVASQSKTA
jgi:NAD(P)-dependent dehydrogenase (short-subunit alcohol dehydrogenase family)